jgi:hypothetical protein
MIPQESAMAIQTAAILAASAMLCGSLSAQWLKFPTAGIPRTPDGKPDLTAPAPKTRAGVPDVAGLWEPVGGYIGNLARDLKPGTVPFQPWAEALYRQRQENQSKDDPTGNCIPGGVPRSDAVPYPFKIVSSDGLMMILYEAVHSYRQIFMDGRPLPKDPNPAWQGYSVGHWDAEGLVVESAGFVENSWLDNGGHPGTESLHVTERFRRKDFGHMNIEVTIDDPKAYTKPWNATIPLQLMPDTDLLEYICSENNKDLPHLVGK